MIPVLILALLLAGTPGIALPALIAGLAAATVIVAADERRDTAMLIAAGIALGLGPVGWPLVPVAIGIGIRRRRWAMLAAMAPVALLTSQLPAIAAPATLPTLFALSSHWPDLFALVVASGCATAAWIGATAWEGRMSLPQLATLALLGGACFVPTPLVALIPPLVLIASRRQRTPSRPRAANDDAPHARPIRLAA